MPPREIAQKTICQAGIECIPKEETLLFSRTDPWDWKDTIDVSFATELHGCTGKQDSDEKIQRAAEKILENVKTNDIVCWTDGSAEEGTKNGGAGAIISIPGEDEITIKEASGAICSSFKAEMVAIERALSKILYQLDEEIEFDRTLWLFSDSLSSIITLSQGPGDQTSLIGSLIWEHLQKLANKSVRVNLQWIPGHKNISGNEKADKAAGEASKLPQHEVPIDFQTSKARIKRMLKEEWRKEVEEEKNKKGEKTLYSKITAGLPKRVEGMTRKEEIIIHQLRVAPCSRLPPKIQEAP